MSPALEKASALEAGLPVASGRDTVRRIARIGRRHQTRITTLVVLGITSAAVSLIPPIAIGVLIDRVQDDTAHLGTALGTAAVMASSAAVGAWGAATTIALATRVYHTILAELREQLVERAMVLPQHRVEEAGAGDLVSRTSDDVTAIADAAPAVTGVLTTTAFTIVVSLIGLSALQWPYAVAFAVVLPVYVLAMRWYLRTGPRVYRAERSATSTRTQQILESQRGYDTVLGLGLAGQRHRAVLSASWGVAIHVLRARTVQSMFNARLNLSECLSLTAILIVGFLLIRNGSSTVGAATTAMLLVLRLLEPINQMLFVVDTIQSAAASLNRIVGVITMPTAQPDEPEKRTDFDAAVRLHAVTFRYGDGPRVLDNISLEISEGEHMAVVGASGAGKTTLATVITGIHPPETGTVIRPPRTAVITQEVHVFSGTLRENLTLADPDANDQKIHNALETTGASAFLSSLPDGLDTLVGSGGHQLTDAQAQQLALARLLLVDPELVILDEATAEAGSAYAGLLDRGSAAALRGRTGVVIAHRLSQAAACDRIVVMEGGRIIEIGTHDGLVAADGMYAKLWSAWQD